MRAVMCWGDGSKDASCHNRSDFCKLSLGKEGAPLSEIHQLFSYNTKLFFLQTSHARAFCVAFCAVRSVCNALPWEKASPDPLHIVLAHPQRAKLAHLEDGDDGPQQGVKILPVRNCISCVCPEAELATKDVHSQDAVWTRSGDGVKYKYLCHYNELIGVILFSSQQSNVTP